MRSTKNGLEMLCLEKMVNAVAEFFDLPESDVRERLHREHDDEGVGVAAAWTDADPGTDEEITRFYEETDAYVFEQAADHCRPRRRAFWEVVLERLHRAETTDVLAYGDGIGTDAIGLARAGYRAAYFDLPGITSGFARFRFAREGVGDRIAFFDRVDELPDESFDAVLCVEVLEHLPDPVATMRRFHSLLRDDGLVLLSESFEDVGPRHPSHLETNYRYAGRTHQLMESIGFASTFFNRDPINRPMEFRKVAPGASGAIVRAWGKAKRALITRRRYLAARMTGNRPG